MLVEWILSAIPSSDGEGVGNSASSQVVPSSVTVDFGIDQLEALQTAVTFAPNPLSAVREARAWLEIIAPTQQQQQQQQGSHTEGKEKGKKQQRSALKLPSLTHASHLLALIGCCPSNELEVAFPSLARELLALIRRQRPHRGGGGNGGGGGGAGGRTASARAGVSAGDDDDDEDDMIKTRVVALAAVDGAVRRLLHNTGGTAPTGGGGGGTVGGGTGGGNKVGGVVEAGGSARQAVVSVLPKLVPAVVVCLEGVSTIGADGASSSEPPPPSVAVGALGVLEALVFLLRSTMKPYAKKVEAATVLWLQGPSDVIRDRAATVLASLPLCGESEAWTQAMGRVTLEAHGLLHTAWPDDDVDMGNSDHMSASQVDAALRSGAGLLPPLEAEAGEGFNGPQQVLASLVSRRFKGLCRVLELMLVGDSNGRPVVVPVVLILALVERVQRVGSSGVNIHGPQAFIPVAHGGLSPGAMQSVRPSLSLAVSRLLHALATAEASTVLRNARRFCRALVQGIPRPSNAGSLRAAGYRSISRAALQLGEGSAPYLATPALPALLAEVRGVVSASNASTPETATAEDGGSGSSGGARIGGKRNMGIEPAMSARKSSQKKQRRAREKEVGRALAAADAKAIASAASNGASLVSNGGGSGSGGNSLRWTGAAADAEQEAVCAALSCLSQLVVCCKGHFPLGGRHAVEEVLHRGLELLAHARMRGSDREGSAGAGSGGGGAWGALGEGSGNGCPRLEDPSVVRELIGLAQACLMTPLADGTRSGCFSIAMAVFQAFSSHPEQRLAAASQRALAGCGAILYPRTAPLHLPHAVTTQAHAWGDDGGGVGVGRSHGLPLGWGGTLMEKEEESDESEGSGDRYENHAQTGRGGGVGGGGGTLTVKAAGISTDTFGPAGATPVVTPPAPLQVAVLDRDSHGVAASKAVDKAGKVDGTPGLRAEKSNDGAQGVKVIDGGNLGREGDGLKQASRSRAVREGDGHVKATVSARGKGPRNVNDAMEEEEEEEEEEERGKEEVDQTVVASECERGDDKTQLKQRSHQNAATTATAPAASVGGGDDGGDDDHDDDDDDDGFEFPAIVDADPDDE